MSDSHNLWPERIDPLREAPGVVAHHLKKYEFAQAHVHGVVIDVACGVGYGSAFLAASADTMVGVEIADDAIAIARDRYRRGNTWFVQGNAERLPLADGVADAITCFEGIEHFVDPETHLADVLRVLKAEGVYLVSTPHPDANPHGEENPYHLHEFDPGDFDRMLRARFRQVTLLGQKRLQSTVHRKAQRLDVLGLRRWALLRPFTKRISRTVLHTAPVDEATLGDFAIEPFDGVAKEYVAVCRGPLAS